MVLLLSCSWVLWLLLVVVVEVVVVVVLVVVVVVVVVEAGALRQLTILCYCTTSTLMLCVNMMNMTIISGISSIVIMVVLF